MKQTRATSAAVALLLTSALATALTACGSAASPGGASTPAGGAGSGATTPAAGSPDRSMGGQAAADGVELTADLRSEGGSVIVTYTVTNVDTVSHLVVDRIPEQMSSAVLDPGLDPAHAWVILRDGHVAITKQTFEIAPNVRFAAAPVVGARVLEPGTTITGTARVPSPLALHVPGEEFVAPRTAIPAAASQVEFCVQHFAEPQPRPVQPVGDAVQIPTTYASDAKLICTGPIALN